MNKLLNISELKDLKSIAECHINAFPGSFSSKLGVRYVMKTLEWFLKSGDNKILIHIEEDNKVLGYCSGYIRKGESQGSSSSMVQYAFKQCIHSLAMRPWLLFNKEIINNFSFITKNVKYRLSKVKKEKEAKFISIVESKKDVAGLVGIGVDPHYQGKGYGAALLQEFENWALKMGARELKLSVKSGNNRAIASYSKNGWNQSSPSGETIIMTKKII